MKFIKGKYHKYLLNNESIYDYDINVGDYYFQKHDGLFSLYMLINNHKYGIDEYFHGNINIKNKSMIIHICDFEKISNIKLKYAKEKCCKKKEALLECSKRT